MTDPTILSEDQLHGNCDDVRTPEVLNQCDNFDGMDGGRNIRDVFENLLS